ncbi:hypothetical protein ACS0TY_007946 [Phlomoides rotata]
MGFDFEGRKPLLYADLFKPRKKGEQNLTQKCEEWSTTSNHDSSSSGFTTPLGSELGSSESDDGDFIAELSRQMVECMLQEDEEDEINNPVADVDRNRNSCLEMVSQLKNQAPVSRGRRVKGGELTQQMQFQKTEQNYGRYREGKRRNGQVGSGMRAVFLGGSGSRNGSSGTGVFLPRVATKSVEPKKKSGLSTVLIPTRVLDALELHFNRLSDSAAGGSPHHASPSGTFCIRTFVLQEITLMLTNDMNWKIIFRF